MLKYDKYFLRCAMLKYYKYTKYDKYFFALRDAEKL